MPTFSFRNKETDEVFDQFFRSWKDKDAYLAENENVEQIPNIPQLSYNDARKPDDSFRDILRNIKKHHPRGDVNTF